MSGQSLVVKARKPWLVLVGGFLGSGKTTLLIAAVRELEQRGLRCALILNDQGEALVDTHYASLNGAHARQVTKGCFCCKLSEMVQVIDELRTYSPDVIFAEPVGSCTDIVATVLRPLREYSEFYRLAPFTVLVDPNQAGILLGDNADPNLSFLFRKQLQEADLICFTKSDLHLACPDLPAHSVRRISARTGQGITAWLDEIFSGQWVPGDKTLDIDYEQYVQAEAALVWLNLQVVIEPKIPLSPAMVLGPFLNDLDTAFTAERISIVHLKAILNSQAGFLKAAICSNGQEPEVEGNLDASPAPKHDLLLNLRTLGPAIRVQEIIEGELSRLEGKLTGLQIDCFNPAAPKPEQRIPKGR